MYMLIGLLMALSISVFIVSGVVILSNFSTTLHSSITAAVIGSSTIYSFSVTLFAISALIIFILILFLKKKNK